MFRKLKDWNFERKMANQRKKKKFADCDCWGMHYWLSDTFADMILNLRDMKHGAPELKFEEYNTLPTEWLNKELALYKEKQIKEGYTYEINIFTKWYIILTRIAYCLKQANDEITIIDNEYREEFDRVVWGDGSFLDHMVPCKFDSKGKPTCYELKTNEPPEELKEKYFNREQEIFEYRNKMKDEAFDLIKKYFWNLWD